MKVDIRPSPNGQEIRLEDGNWYNMENDDRLIGKNLSLEIVPKPVIKKEVEAYDTKKMYPIDQVFMVIDQEGEVKYVRDATSLQEAGWSNHTIHSIHPCPILYQDIDVFCKMFSLKECREQGILVDSRDANEKPKKERYLQLKKKVLNLEKNSYLTTNGLEYTFGVEFETCNGTVAPWVWDHYNVNIICERDGSVKGGEYITGVLKGDSGFLELYKISKVLRERCEFDSTCGMHVHVGNAIFNSNFIVVAYLFAIKIQDSLFEYFPKSRRNNVMCSKLPVYPQVQNYIDDLGYYCGCKAAYEFLFEKLANGRKLGAQVNKSLPHPGGRYTDRYSRGNGEITNDLLRYKWFNLITTAFDTRGVGKQKPRKDVLNNGISHTLEFRNHHATFDYLSTSYWVLICMAMTSYIENNAKDIIQKETLCIHDVLKSVYNENKARNISNYLNDNKTLFADYENKEALVDIDYYNKTTKGDVIKMLI